MNNARRKQIKEAKSYIEKAKDILENVKYDEEYSFDNLSDGLQQTMRGEQMEENIDILDENIERLENIVDALDSIK